MELSVGNQETFQTNVKQDIQLLIPCSQETFEEKLSEILDPKSKISLEFNYEEVKRAKNKEVLYYVDSDKKQSLENITHFSKYGPLIELKEKDDKNLFTFVSELANEDTKK